MSDADERQTKGVVPMLLSPDCEAHIEWLKRVLGAELKGEIDYAPESYDTAPADGAPPPPPSADLTEQEHHDSAPAAKKKIIHAELAINGGKLFISDNISVQAKKLMSEDDTKTSRGVMLYVCMPDVEDVWKRSLEAGAKEVLKLGVQYWGAKFGTIADPWGFEWSMDDGKRYEVPPEVEEPPAKKHKVNNAE